MALTPSAPRPQDNPDSAFASVWRAPLAPVALAVTAGIVADRALGVPPTVATIVVGVGLIGWAAGLSKSAAAGLPFLWAVFAAAGALHHHQYRSTFAADDIGRITAVEPRLVRLRGRLAEEPTTAGLPISDPLRSMPRSEPARTVLAVTQVRDRDDWRSASGRARLVAAGPLDGLHTGDFIETVGWLSAPGEPANPGEFDPAGHYLDERITALLSVHKTSEGVVRLSEGWADAPSGWLAAVRGWGRRTLEAALPPERSGVAAALILGDGSAMAQVEWDKYIRTGVIHALAISGQHLIILATFLWLVLRLAGLPRKRGAWVVAIVLIAYAALTGGRPPATRAAVMVALICGGLVLRRIVLPANAFALAMLIVLVLQPTDIADAGCQLSFLCVAMLTWGLNGWFTPRPPDPLEQLIDASRPGWLRAARWAVRWLLVSYGITWVLGLTVIPLVAYRYHVIAPIGFLIGPAMVTGLQTMRLSRRYIVPPVGMLRKRRPNGTFSNSKTILSNISRRTARSSAGLALVARFRSVAMPATICSAAASRAASLVAGLATSRRCCSRVSSSRRHCSSFAPTSATMPAGAVSHRSVPTSILLVRVAIRRSRSAAGRSCPARSACSCRRISALRAARCPGSRNFSSRVRNTISRMALSVTPLLLQPWRRF